LLEDKAFSLKLTVHRAGQNLRGGFVDILGDVAERGVRFYIEAKRDAGELVDVIDRLQAECLLRVGHGARRS
jgi:hypothetical protein